MKRRKFIEYSTQAGGSFIVSLDLLNPKRTEAFPLLSALLGGTVMDLVFGALLQGAFALASRAWRQRTQQWYDRRLEAQLAQSKFIARSFTNVAVAQTNSPQYSIILAAQSQYPEELGYNAAFCFPRLEQSQPIISTFAGPACIGMAFAARYLRQYTRMNLQEIQAAILPRNGGSEYDDWRTWSDPNSSRAYPNLYSDSAGVLITYESVNPHPGGYGLIDVTVNANQLIKVPQIKVEYPRV